MTDRDGADHGDLARPGRHRAARRAHDRPHRAALQRPRRGAGRAHRRTSRPPTPTAASRSAPGCAPTLESSPLVESVRFESQQQAYERYQELFAGPVARRRGPPAVAAGHAAGAARRPGGRRRTPSAQAMTGQVGVRNVIDQREVVAKLFDFLGGVRNVTFALAARAGDRRAAADLQHGAGLGVHPAHRGRRDAAGRRHPLVHPAAVPHRGGGHRRGRRADRRRRGCWPGSSCSSTSCCPGSWPTAWCRRSRWPTSSGSRRSCVMIGAGIAAVTGYVTLRLYVRL